MSKILAKLNTIQVNLNAPKGQINKFGGYNYRSMEDIANALKPLLEQTQTTFRVSDEVVMVGDRFYVKATATLTCCESGEYACCDGWAREAQSKKGMDESQITGATSSYARKYAANGLFCIDDTKDADATNKHGKSGKDERQYDGSKYEAINDFTAGADKAATSQDALAKWFVAAKKSDKFKNMTDADKKTAESYVTQLSEAMAKNG